LASSAAGKNIRQMDKLGLLEIIIPQVAIMYQVRQGGYHHLDVWGHTLSALDELEKLIVEFSADKEMRDYLNLAIAGERSRLALLKLAVILHDIGKPQTFKKENGKVSFHGHEHVGKGIVRHIVELLKLSNREGFILQDMVLYHLRPGYLSNFKKPSDRAMFRYFRDTKDEAASIALLSLADQRATKGPMTTKKDQAHHEKICRMVIRAWFAKQKEKPFVRLINGNDLIKELKLTPSPLFAKILEGVEEAQAAGEIGTRQEALVLAKEIVTKSQGHNVTKGQQR